MEKLRKQPLWRDVVDAIATDVQERGYGIFYSHEDLRGMLDIPKPKTIQEYEKKQFEYLNALDGLKNELLEEHNIFFDNKRGDGYVVVQPDEQVTSGTDKQLKRARKFLIKANQLLLCVEEELLSAEASRMRLEKMKRVAFLRGAFNKRKFPAIQEVKTKLITG